MIKEAETKLQELEGPALEIIEQYFSCKETLKNAIRIAEERRHQLILQKQGNKLHGDAKRPESGKKNMDCSWKFAINVGGKIQELPTDFQSFKRTLQPILRKHSKLEARTVYYQLVRVAKGQDDRQQIQENRLEIKGGYCLLFSVNGKDHCIVFSIQPKRT